VTDGWRDWAHEALNCRDLSVFSGHTASTSHEAPCEDWSTFLISNSVGTTRCLPIRTSGGDYTCATDKVVADSLMDRTSLPRVDQEKAFLDHTLPHPVGQTSL